MRLLQPTTLIRSLFPIISSKLHQEINLPRCQDFVSWYLIRPTPESNDENFQVLYVSDFFGTGLVLFNSTGNYKKGWISIQDSQDKIKQITMFAILDKKSQLMLLKIQKELFKRKTKLTQKKKMLEIDTKKTPFIQNIGSHFRNFDLRQFKCDLNL